MAHTNRGWRVELNGVLISGDGTPSPGCLMLPPDGLGLPGLRDEDVTFPQRDGVRHYADWYEPRIITLEVLVGGNCCRGCGDERVRVREILRAWSRECDDVELIIYPPCEPHPVDRTNTGPYAVIGRPRRAEVVWRRGRRGIADLVLRFDAVDHRMYVLDEDGTPGSGVECVTLTPQSLETTRCYERCYSRGDGAIPPVLVRTNAHPNPYASGLIGWSATGRPLTLAGEMIDGIGGAEATVTDATAGRLLMWSGNLPGSLVVAGGGNSEVSAYVRRSSAGRVQLQAEWLDENGASIGYSPTEYGPIPAGELTRIQTILTAPTAARSARIVVSAEATGLASGDKLFVGGVMVGPGEPFAGSTAPTDEFEYRWAGTPYESASQEWTIGSDPSGDGSWCYDHEAGSEGAGPVTFTVRGDTCVSPTITLYGTLTNPVVENLNTGASVGYRGTLGPGEVLVINTEEGTATSGGVSRTHLLTGDPRLILDEGENTLRLTSYSSQDTGYAEACFRPVVLSA